MTATKLAAAMIDDPKIFVGALEFGGVFLTRRAAQARSYALGETPPHGFCLARVSYAITDEDDEPLTDFCGAN